MFDVKDTCLKQLETEGGDPPPGLVELEVTDNIGDLVLTDALITMGYRAVGHDLNRDVVDEHTGEVVVPEMRPWSAVEGLHLAVRERQRALVLVDALEQMGGNPLAKFALREYEDACNAKGGVS